MDNIKERNEVITSQEYSEEIKMILQRLNDLANNKVNKNLI